MRDAVCHSLGSWQSLVAAGSLVVTLGACDSGWRNATARALLPRQEFADVFQRIDSVVLEQPFDFPLVNLVGLDVSSRGFVVADVGEARVSVFGLDGRLRTAIGRRGDGPGEFRFPRAPHFDVHGRIHVADALQQRISVFSDEGELLREVSTPSGFLIQDMDLTRTGYILAGQPPLIPGDAVLVAIDSLGRIEWKALDIVNQRPAGEKDSPRWQTLRSHAVALIGDTALVTHTLFDSLWAVPVAREGAPTARAITVEGYEAPRMPDQDPTSPSEITEWATQQMRAATVEGDGELVIVPFTKGAYWKDAVPSLAACRDPAGRWLTLTNTPVVLRAVGRRLYTLERPNLEDFVIGVYEWRSS